MPHDRTQPGVGMHLVQTDVYASQVEELVALLGGRIGLAGVLSDLRWRIHPSLLGRLLGRSVRRAWRFDAHDQADARWWPQGVSVHEDRNLVLITWYSKKVDGRSHGSRISIIDLDAGRYRHVLLVKPVQVAGELMLQPLTIHAGGIVWSGDWVHVAATAQGIWSARIDDIMRVPADLADAHTFGHRFLLPVRNQWQAHTDEGHESLRYSFLSVDPHSPEPVLMVGEYGRDQQSTRIARFALDPATGQPRTDSGGIARPLDVDPGGVRQMQGVVGAQGRLHVSVSRGPWRPGDVFVGRPGQLRRHRFAVPMGPEDLAYRRHDDTLWTVTEHPHRRWLVQMSRRWFDR